MSTLLITHLSCLQHDTGEYHPERPDRLRVVLKALSEEGFGGLVKAEAPKAEAPAAAEVPKAPKEPKAPKAPKAPKEQKEPIFRAAPSFHSRTVTFSKP